MKQFIRAALNISSVAMTGFLVIYELTAITDDTTLRAGLFVGAITIEAGIQYNLSLALAYLRQGGFNGRVRGVILLAFYGWYVIIFAIMAGIGFFSAELAGSETVYQVAEDSREFARQRIGQIDSLLATMEKQLAAEARTGYGSQSQALMAEIGKLAAERRDMASSIASRPEAAGAKSLFRSLAEISGKPEGFFKVLVFGTLIVMLYLIQIITAWRIDFTATTAAKPETIATAQDETITAGPIVSIVSAKGQDTAEGATGPITQNLTPPVPLGEEGKSHPAATGQEAICPCCGQPFLKVGRKKYCSDKCRLAAFRGKELTIS